MEPKTKRILLALVGGWLLVIAIFTTSGAIVLHRETRAAEKVLQEYTGSLVARQFDEAYELTGPDFRSQTARDDFLVQQLDLEKRFGRLESVKEQGWKVSSTGSPQFWAARFSVDFHYQNDSRRFEFALRKQSGKWMLYGYEETGEVNRP